MENSLNSNGTVTGSVHYWLRLEGLAMLIAATSIYGHMQFSWMFFALLFLVPDVSMAGYFINRRLGADIYNIGHSYISVLLVAGLGFLLKQDTILAISIIWLAHIGFDRVVGYGLKYGDDFKHTHLGTPFQRN